MILAFHRGKDLKKTYKTNININTLAFLPGPVSPRMLRQAMLPDCRPICSPSLTAFVAKNSTSSVILLACSTDFLSSLEEF